VSNYAGSTPSLLGVKEGHRASPVTDDEAYENQLKEELNTKLRNALADVSLRPRAVHE
jgi:hypothetical protein